MAGNPEGHGRTFSFRPSARLQRYIGEELISDPNLAVLEFVKNAYDAGASKVRIEFALTGGPTRLTICDNGVGMTATEFEENWMHPGFSHKSLEAVAASPRRGTDSAARRLARQRTPAGEKGLGRMAAGRLAGRLDVYTRTSTRQPWLHVPFDWSDFDDMTKAMDEIRIASDYATPPPPGSFSAGTVVVMTGLSLAWDGRIRGRPVAGRKRTRLGRLKQDLEYLVRPITAASDESNFEVELASDSVAEVDDTGVISPQVMSLTGEYVYDFRFVPASRTAPASILRTVTRSPAAAAAAGQAEYEALPTAILDKVTAKGESRPATLGCGPFEGRFLYTPPPAARRALEVEATVMGVLLYRDGVLVEPYGLDGNDWVGVNSRKAQRQGHAAVQPNTFTGSVLIGREANADLQDMSNRMGLLSSDSSEEFQAHVRAEFGVFERLVYHEVFESRWEGNKEDEAGRRAEDAAEITAIYLRSLAHNLRQPLAGLQVEMSNLETLEGRQDISEFVRDQVARLRGRTGRHIERADRLVRQVLDLQVPVFGESSLSGLVAQAVEQVQPTAESSDVKVRVEAATDRVVLVPGGLVVQALASLISNGIEAPRPPGRSAEVLVRLSESDGDMAVEIRDDGSGIPKATPETPFEDITSSKGRPAIGLVSARLNIAAARGRVSILETGPEGTTLRVLLPDRVAGLRAPNRASG